MLAIIGLVWWAIACEPGAGNDGDDTGEPAAEPIFPLDSVAGWHEGRPCGFTHEHELRYIRVVTNEAATTPYRELNADHRYAIGATLVKLEYEDENCTELLEYTAMRKMESGYSEFGNDWRWQRVAIDGTVLKDGEIKSCIDCHAHHCTWPECGYEDCGFDLTCGIEETK
ncbi:hypothetical protein K8I61_07660 [bacterium]|nr:hypothetical protein [bacterium]